MNESIILLDDIILAGTCVMGLVRYKRLDTAMRTVAILLVICSVVELSAFFLTLNKEYFIKNVVYNVYTIIELVLVTMFFLKINRTTRYRQLMIVNVIIWPVFGLLNMIFLQHLGDYASNIVLLECFSVITMSLYSIYHMLKNDMAHAIFLNMYFWMAILWLVEFSSTFFFFSFLSILYRSHWKYINVALDMNVIINIIVYSGTFAVLFFYPKSVKTVENK